MTDACAWNLNAFCFIPRDVFFGSQRCRDTFSHIATFPAATADRARNTPLTPIGKCRALYTFPGTGTTGTGWNPSS